MERLVFFLYRFVTGLIARLSLPTAFRAGEIAGACAWMLAGKYRGLVRRNLRIAFPGKSGEEIAGLARAHFRQLGANLFSSIKVAAMDSAEIDRHVEMEGLDRMKAVFKSGRGVVMMIAHLGNWELFAQLAHHLPDRERATIYQPLGNRLIDADVRRTRAQRGVRPLSRRQGFTEAVRILKEKGLVGVLVDQHAGDGGVWAPFFDRLASTSPLAAILAQKTGAAVVPVAIYTTGPARWRVVVSEPLPPATDSDTLTATINGVLADQIRVRPADWFWVHERWKTPRPDFLLARYRRGVVFPPGYDRARLQPFRILIRSSNWLGDAVMTVPAVRAIAAGRPDAQVTVLTPEKLAGFWRSVPEVEVVETIAARESVWSVGRKLRKRFDVAVVLPNSLRTGLEVWLGGIPRRAGYPGHSRRALLDQVFEPPPAEPGPPPHQVHRYFDLAHWLGANTADIAPPVRIPPPSSAPARVGLCPGAEYGAAKRYPAESFLEATRLIGAEHDVVWTLFGVAGDAPAGNLLAEGLGGQCRNLIGQTTLDELMTELAQCELLLTNDTGTMHLAAHLGVPVVAIFGSTEPALTGPLGTRHTIVRRHVECSPCFLRECPIDFRCMRELEPATVAQAVLARLAPATS